VLLLISSATQPLILWTPFATAVLALVTNTPHYGATLLRVYEHRSDRRRYGFFAVHATLLIFGLFVGGLYWAPLGSLLLTRPAAKEEFRSSRGLLYNCQSVLGRDSGLTREGAKEVCISWIEQSYLRGPR
jgi:hypothetical protein